MVDAYTLLPIVRTIFLANISFFNVKTEHTTIRFGQSGEKVRNWKFDCPHNRLCRRINSCFAIVR